MSPQDIQKAFEDRLNAVHELRKLADETRGSELSAEEAATMDAQNDAIDSLDEKIQTGLRSLRRDQEAASALDEFRSYGDLSIVPETAKTDGKVDESEMFRQLVSGEIRSYESFASEQRDLVKGTNSAGGFTVESTMYDRIVQKLEDSSKILDSGVTILRTDRGEDITVQFLAPRPSERTNILHSCKSLQNCCLTRHSTFQTSSLTKAELLLVKRWHKTLQLVQGLLDLKV